MLELRKSTGQSPCLAGVRILVVDDDDSLEPLRELLESAGVSIQGVRSAEDALASRGPFDLVISDIGMPEIDGYTLMRYQAHMSKPIDADSLIATVREWTRRRTRSR